MVVAGFLDITNAYGDVHVAGTVRCLDNFGLPVNYNELIWELTKQKESHYLLNGEVSRIRTTRSGLSQGLPTAPILYNLDTASIDSVLEEGVQLLQFADDQVFFCAEKIVEVAERKIQRTINNLMNWVATKGFNFSVEKSEFVVFSRKHKDPEVRINMNDMILTQSPIFRYLGVQLDRKLIMKAHVEQVQFSCKKAINCLRSIAGKSWGMDPTCMLMLYKGLIRSKLEYCAFVYSKKNCHVKQLEKIQWRALRCCTGLMQSSHTQAVEIIAGIPPLRERFQYLTQRFLNICGTQPHHPLPALLATGRTKKPCPFS